MNSNRKGKVFEREIAQYLREHGYIEARRGQQYKGGADSPDVIGLTGFHIECKRTERFDLYGSLKQSKRDSGENEIPIVVHRKNNEQSVVVISLDDFMEVINGQTRSN